MAIHHGAMAGLSVGRSVRVLAVLAVFLLVGRCASPLTAGASPLGGSGGKEGSFGRTALEEYAYQTWQLRDGLPDITVESFAETPDGYLWIGTRAGLVRFDGAHFKVFNHENTPAFHSDDVYSLLADRKGGLWIGTIGVGTGGLIELRDEVFRRYVPANGLRTEFVRQILEDHQGRIWVATDGALTWARDGQLVDASAVFGHGKRFSFALLEDHLGGIWATAGMRLTVLRGEGTAARVEDFAPAGQDSRLREMSLLESRDGTIWLGTASGLLRKPAGSREFKRVPEISSAVRKLFEAPNGEVWAGTAGQGVQRFRNGRIASGEPPIHLPSNTVYTIFMDSSRNIWIGTLGGMVRLSPTSVHLLELPKAADSDFGTVALDSDGSLWAASTRLVHIVDDHAVTSTFPALGNARVRTVSRALDGSLWIGTDGSGAFRLSQHGVLHLTVRDGLVTDFVRAILDDGRGSVWIGGDGGLSRIDRGGIHTPMAGNGYASYTVHDILKDRDGSIWVGGDGGLFHFRDGAMVGDALTQRLHNQRILSLFQNKAGDLWAGTQTEGLFLFRNGKPMQFATTNGMTSNTITCVLDDSQGHVWVGTARGVLLIKQSEFEAVMNQPGHRLSYQFFSADESTPPVRLYDSMNPEGVLSPDNSAWFATNQGLWRIRPSEVEQEPLSRLNLADIVVDGQGVPVASKLTLAADSRRVEIGYVPIMLRSQENVRFRYRLAGYDRDWVYANTGDRQAVYTNLPPGQYSFRVEAWETNHPERVVAAGVDFVKNRHFYQTVWFLSLCGLFAVLIAVGVYRFKVMRMHDRFDAALAERTRLAREMHDTLIQGCVGVSSLLKAALRSRNKDHESFAHLVQYAATQVHATLDEARQEIQKLRGDEQPSISLSSAVEGMASRAAQAHGVKIAERFTGTAYPISSQAMHDLLMIARESIFNAILHGGAPEIAIEIAYLEESLRMTIRDNGRGFDVQASGRGGHFGLLGMQERVHKLRGEFAVESAPGEGTTVRVDVPRTAISG